MAHTVRAQNSPQDFLDAHNTARVCVAVGPMSWDDGVAAYANKRRADYQLFHSGGTSSRDAVSLWVAEKQYSDYDSNTCDGGKVCGHYTQVVWANSVYLGLCPRGVRRRRRLHHLQLQSARQLRGTAPLLISKALLRLSIWKNRRIKPSF
ncbi:pathogenesis-related protein 1A-like [Musa acuminata AAA Group]|uniref:pathogenesis-related protein 1A-like n=1 Tax=Musa acuminata AAA Group TaxID=214697 RepID=UPI0031D70633